MTALRQRMLQGLRIRNYAPSTVTCYARSVAALRFFFGNTLHRGIGVEQIQEVKRLLEALERQNTRCMLSCRKRGLPMVCWM